MSRRSMGDVMNGMVRSSSRVKSSWRGSLPRCSGTGARRLELLGSLLRQGRGVFLALVLALFCSRHGVLRLLCAFPGSSSYNVGVLAGLYGRLIERAGGTADANMENSVAQGLSVLVGQSTGGRGSPWRV